MKLLDLLNPVTFYKTLTRCWRNLESRRFYNRTVKKMQSDGLFKQFGMRLDMRNRAYYILNLEAETLMAGPDTLELERSRVFESLGIRKPIFEKAELGELIEAKTDRIKTSDYYAYLIQIKYRPFAKFSEYFYVLSWSALAAFLCYWLIQGMLHSAEIWQLAVQFMNRK